MTDHNHPHTITAVARAGFFNGGPLDGTGFLFWLPTEPQIGAMHINVAVGEDVHLYVFAEQPDPASLEAGLRYIGVVNGPA